MSDETPVIITATPNISWLEPEHGLPDYRRDAGRGGEAV